MPLSLFGLMLLTAAPVVKVPSSDYYAKILNAPENAILSCEIVPRADGGHLIMVMRQNDAGEEIHISDENGASTYDYIFSTYVPPKAPYKTSSSTLGQRDQIDIPLRTAWGLKAHKPAPIFTKKGIYSVYIGYGFRTDDEAEIYGACGVSIDMI